VGGVEVAALSKLVEALAKVADECEALDPDLLTDAELLASLLMLRREIDLVEGVLARCTDEVPPR
jgi:hypothetical protein